MSLHCDWFVLCEQVLADQQTNNLTLVNCLEQVAAPRFPAHHPRFAFAARYSWAPEELPAEDVAAEYRLVRISGEDEEVIAELGGPWGAHLRTGRVFVNFGVVRLFEPGRIRFRLEHRLQGGDWVEDGEQHLDVYALSTDEGAEE